MRGCAKSRCLAFSSALSLVGAVAGGSVLPIEWAGEIFTATSGHARRLMVDLPSGCRGLRLTGGMKATDVVCGPETWQNGRLSVMFLDESGSELSKPYPRQQECVGTTDWIDIDHTYLVPSNAVKVRLGFHNFGPSGRVEFRKPTLEMTRGWAKGPCDAREPGGPGRAEALPAVRKSGTRLELSLEGFWRCRPSFAGERADFVPRPGDCWGWAPVPSCWLNERKPFPPTAILSPWVEDCERLASSIVHARAWYGRSIRFPQESMLAGRRTLLRFKFLNTRAVVYVDGQRAGEAVFPCGDVDVTGLIRPGRSQFVALDVTAWPRDLETLNYNAPDRSDKVKSTVMYKGLTGGVDLLVVPAERSITDACVRCDVERKTVTFVAEVEGFPAGEYSVEANVRHIGGGDARLFSGRARRGDPDHSLSISCPWPDVRIWDVDAPENLYLCRLAVRETNGTLIDETLPFRFGFRDVKTRGRDLLLNGTPIHLRALYGHALGAVDELTDRKTLAESCRRFRDEGFNTMLSGTYRFREGRITRIDNVLDVCDETGMLFAYPLPHIYDFNCALDDPPTMERYRQMTRQAISFARNHPSVILYAMNHNCTGYGGDQNPQRMDGTWYEGEADRDAVGFKPKNRKNARLAQAVAEGIDPTRPIYHHESGNLGGWHTLNIYLNWAPRQERSDWIGHWATDGVKPLFFVEWGLPDLGSWSSYRGPHFLWTTPVRFTTWAAEYAAAVRGDVAYEDTPEMHALLASDDAHWASGKPFSFDIPRMRALTNLCHGVQAYFANDNWRAFRTWGLTAVAPYGQGGFFRRVNPAAKGLEYWAGLGRGSDWEPTAIGRAFRRWNQDVIGYVGGYPSVTDKRHHYRPSEQVRKTLVVVNDRRRLQEVAWSCTLADERRSGRATVEPGHVLKIPLEVRAPSCPGTYNVVSEFDFGDTRQRDAFGIEVLETVKPRGACIRLLDDWGATKAEFDRLAVPYVRIGTNEAAEAKAAIVVGSRSLTADLLYGHLVGVAKQGGNVLVFEQDQKTLESVGFRVQEYGLRKCFSRYKDERLSLLIDSRLENWAGESTLTPPYFEDIPALERSEPKRAWSGFRNTRVWRCGNRASVATILPEKPTCGDWRPLADGGFDLQYSPLLEWRVGKGRIVFCQFDVTGRTEHDPFADDLIVSLVNALDGAERPARQGDFLLVKSGDSVPAGLADRVAAGASVFCCGLSRKEIEAVSPIPLPVAPTNGCFYSRIRSIPPEFNGLSNADWAWHGAMDFTAFLDRPADGNSSLRVVRYGKGRLVFMQVAPWNIDDRRRPQLRTSRRRAEFAFARICGNLGFESPVDRIGYGDKPMPDDDPYRYIRW